MTRLKAYWQDIRFRIGRWPSSKWHQHTSYRDPTGRIEPCLAVLFSFFEHITLLGCIRILTDLVLLFKHIDPVLISKHRHPYKFWQNSCFLWKAFGVEIFFFLWLLVEVAFFISLLNYPHLTSSSSFLWSARFLLAWRAFNIFVIWVNMNILGTAEPTSATRLLVLTVLNYIEVAIIFSVIAFLAQSHFSNTLLASETFNFIGDSFRYSIGILITTGSEFMPSTGWGYVIFSCEILFALLFLVIIISRAITYFR